MHVSLMQNSGKYQLEITQINHCLQTKTSVSLCESTSEKTIKECNSILSKHPDSVIMYPQGDKKREIRNKCTHWFHVVAMHQWVVACAWDRMSTVHNSVWFSARLQGFAIQSTHSSSLPASLLMCVCSPHALLPLTYPCWSCSYPQTTYANKGWTIPGSREGWPRIDAIIVVHACSWV